MQRCSWPGNDPEYIRYHDEDWGVPVTDPKELFAKLILDGAQAGLSWITILKKGRPTTSLLMVWTLKKWLIMMQKKLPGC